jgi:cobalt/nickel transport system permease protein
MHLAEGLLPAAHAGAYFAASAPFVISSYRAIRIHLGNSDAREKAFFQLSIALCFAVTLLPLPNPIVGATSHMCATPLLALFFGPRLMILPVALVLLLQALFFAHGGLSTLGANVFTLGVFGPFITWGLFSLMRQARVPMLMATGTACALGSVMVYVCDSVILAYALAGADSFSTWFFRIGLGFLPIQGPLSLLEGVLSALILRSLNITKIIPLPKRVAMAMGVLISLALLPTDAFAYQGLDEKIFQGIAEQAGRLARPVLFEIEGDLLLSFFSIGMFVAGVFVGKKWAELKNFSRKTE